MHANQLSSESEQHAFNNEPFFSKIWQYRDAAIGGNVRVGTLCGQIFPMQSGVSAEVVASFFLLPPLFLHSLPLFSCRALLWEHRV